MPPKCRRLCYTKASLAPKPSVPRQLQGYRQPQQLRGRSIRSMAPRSSCGPSHFCITTPGNLDRLLWRLWGLHAASQVPKGVG